MERRYSQFQAKAGIVSGYVIEWDKAAWIDEISMNERFARDSLRFSRHGVTLHAQHDPKVVLGNTRSGTLKIKSDNRGLFFECQLPENAKLTRELVSRGDLCGSSVGFFTEQDKKEGDMRTIEKGILDEISLVSAPAYQNTIDFRSQKTKPKRFNWTDLL